MFVFQIKFELKLIVEEKWLYSPRYTVCGHTIVLSYFLVYRIYGYLVMPDIRHCLDYQQITKYQAEKPDIAVENRIDTNCFWRNPVLCY